MNTVNDQAQHSTFHVSELPLTAVTVDDETGDVLISFVHRHRVVAAVETLNGQPMIIAGSRVEVEDTFTLRMSNAAAQRIVMELLLPDRDPSFEQDELPKALTTAVELRTWLSEALGSPERNV